jgi:MFS family permease
VSSSPHAGLGRYRHLLTTPGAWAILTLGSLARLPIGMTGLALLLLVQHETGSFAQGGLVSSSYAAALALAAPVRGSAVDRRGGRAVLLLYGAVHPVALLGVLIAVQTRLPLPVLLALTVLAGSTFPPVGPLVRSLWGVLFDDDADRTTAYALDAVLVELAFIGGPLLVGLAVALAYPALAVAGAAALTGIGSLLLARTSAIARLVAQPRGGRASLGAPLLCAPVRRLLGVLLVLGVAFGATEVSVAAYAVEVGSASVAGPILAVWATGSALGGLTYGARAWRWPIERQYLWLVAALTGTFVLPLLALGPISLAALLLVGGAAIAPVFACNSALLARVAPPGATTATFAWSGSGIVAGMSVGVGIAGGLVEHAAGSRAGFALAVLAGTLALSIVITGRRTLTEAPR